MRIGYYDKMDIFDTFTYLTIGPISIVTSFLLFSSHLLVKELRQQPGDLIMLIGFSEFCLSMHWFLSAVFTSYITEDYDNNGLFCKANSIIAVFAGGLEFCYNMSFLVYILFSIKNSVRAGYMPQKSFHVASWTIAAGLLFFKYDKLGRNAYGTCSLASVNSSSMITGALVIVLSMSLAIYVLIYTKKSLPHHTQALAKLKRDFMNFYKNYIIMCLYMWTIILTSFVCQQFGANENFFPKEKQTISGYFFNFGRLGNTAKVMMPALMFFIRTEDPMLRKRIWTPVNRLKKFILVGLDDKFRRESKLDQDAINKEEALKNELETQAEDLNWMNLLPSKMKETFTRTFLAGVSKHYARVIQNQKSEEVSTIADAEEVIMFNIKGDRMMKQLALKDEAIIDCKLTIYAPKVFSDIVRTHFEPISFAESLDIFKNHKAIVESGESGGGKSGELFMFSHDHKLILKTVTEGETKVFLNILHHYKEHLVQNKDSQIGKIFGLFDFNFVDAGKSVKLFVIENINSLQIPSYLRKYDLKGSKYSRTVIKNLSEYDPSKPMKKILKDNDFLAIDKEIPLPTKLRSLFVNTLNRDVQFFKRNRLIDYSFIVAVIDTQLGGAEEVEAEFAKGNHHLIRNGKNPRYVYFCGIIDYFQLYNFNKAFERFAKRVIKCNPSLEISSQPPNFYAARYLQFMTSVFTEIEEQNA